MAPKFHVHSTGLNDSLPPDLPAEQSAAILHLRGAYGPCMSQMYADQGSKPASEADLPRAPLRSHAEYLEFCRCLLDEDGHKCWREMLVNLDVSNSDAWMRFAAKYATLPLLSAHLALPAPVWSIVSSTMLLYLQPVLRHWQSECGPLSPVHAQRLQCTLRASVQVHTRPLLLKLTTGYCVSTFSYPSAPARPRWEP